MGGGVKWNNYTDCCIDKRFKLKNLIKTDKPDEKG